MVILFGMDRELAAGAVVAGRYRLERQLGRGGMGVVWEASHTLTRRRVALKFLLASLGWKPEMRRRGRREARAAGSIRHPNVVDIIDSFELDDAVPVLVMELLPGDTLRQRLDRDRRLDLRTTADILIQVVSAAGTAHSLGILHRDLKPENIVLVDGERRVKVLDFGLAKPLAGDPSGIAETGVTSEGNMLGTPSYMAPEQAFAEPDIDHRADAWSIGVILYECLAGCRPVWGENLGQVVRRLVTEPIRPIAELCPELPEDLRDLVGQLLSERSRRPPDLRPVFDVLSRYASVEAPTFDGPNARGSLPSIPAPALELATQSELVEPSSGEGSLARSVSARSMGVTWRAAGLGLGAVVAVALLWWRATLTEPAAVPQTPLSVAAARTDVAPAVTAAIAVSAATAVSAAVEPAPDQHEARPKPTVPEPSSARLRSVARSKPIAAAVPLAPAASSTAQPAGVYEKVPF